MLWQCLANLSCFGGIGTTEPGDRPPEERMKCALSKHEEQMMGLCLAERGWVSVHMCVPVKC